MRNFALCGKWISWSRKRFAFTILERSQHQGCLVAFGGMTNQDSECQVDEKRSRGWETSCFRFIRSLLAFERQPNWIGETVRGSWHERQLWTRCGIGGGRGGWWDVGDLITVFSARRELYKFHLIPGDKSLASPVDFRVFILLLAVCYPSIAGRATNSL